MPEKLSHTLVRELMDVECPNCKMGFEVEIADVICGVIRVCPCCRLNIHLVADASLVGSLASIDSAMRDVQRTLDGF